MPAPLSTALLVLGYLLCITVTPWAGIPVAAIAVVNEVVKMVLLASAPDVATPVEGEEGPPFGGTKRLDDDE